MHFAFMYESRIMKPAEIVLRSGGRGMRDKNGGGEPIKIYCKHICK
jgi:hypothetical protein